MYEQPLGQIVISCSRIYRLPWEIKDQANAHETLHIGLTTG